MASWISSILSLLSLPASSAKGSEGDVYSWLQLLVNSFSIFCRYRGIEYNHSLWFWFFRDVCLLDTSNSLFWPLFDNWKYSSCSYRDWYDMYVKLHYLSSIMLLIFRLCYCTISFVLRFLWVHFNIFFLLSRIYWSKFHRWCRYLFN